MSDRLNSLLQLPAPSCRRCGWRLAWLAGLALGTGLAGAAELAPERNADPTRPPEAWLARQAPAAASGPQAVAPAEAPTKADAGPRITLVGSQRRLAVIDGQIVRTGDPINGARIVAIQPQVVILQTGAQRQVLRLTPGVEKKTARK